MTWRDIYCERQNSQRYRKINSAWDNAMLMMHDSYRCDIYFIIFLLPFLTCVTQVEKPKSWRRKTNIWYYRFKVLRSSGYQDVPYKLKCIFFFCNFGFAFIYCLQFTRIILCWLIIEKNVSGVIIPLNPIIELIVQ